MSDRPETAHRSSAGQLPAPESRRAPAARWIARRELRAAGITDPGLQEGFLQARRLNAQHGKTYYLATWLLPQAKRPYVHALYGFARYADDIVDDLDPDIDPPQRASRFGSWSEAFLAELTGGSSVDPICRALLHTIDRWQIPPQYFVDFLASMRSDLVVTEYPSYADLEQYMWGSAAVIGLQMLPILGRRDERTTWAELRPYAIDLGVAFQLTNFIRDVGEDLDRGRIYLPQDSLAAHGVDRERMLAARHRGAPDRQIRALLAAEIDRTRRLYRSARAGVELVHPSSRDCLRTALTLYGEILDQVERAGYNVFSGRVSVALPRRLAVAGSGALRAGLARRRS